MSDQAPRFGAVETAHSCFASVYPCPACEQGLYNETRAARARDLALAVVPTLRAIAKQLGYAIGLHGSVARDVDLIAVAWTDEAVQPTALVDALRREVERVSGACHIPEVVRHHVSGDLVPNPDRKPHGRLGWTLHVWGTYIDLSVIGPIDERPKARCMRIVTPPVQAVACSKDRNHEGPCE